jgi:hypothetical protein
MTRTNAFCLFPYIAKIAQMLRKKERLLTIFATLFIYMSSVLYCYTQRQSTYICFFTMLWTQNKGEKM